MEALKSEDTAKWMEAIHSELASLREMRTWELIDKKEVPADARILPCKLVLKIKRHEDGTVERYKARVVILGKLQQVGVEYELTFETVIDFTIVRLMLAVTSKKGYAVHHIDVKSAFLNGQVDADVYMTQSKSFEGPGSEDKVCDLLKSLYRLKQAPRICCERIWADLVAAGFETSRACQCVFKMKEKHMYSPGVRR
jgi:Reverse transcriptase (RNA-dependent DNA polymerase)